MRTIHVTVTVNTGYEYDPDPVTGAIQIENAVNELKQRILADGQNDIVGTVVVSFDPPPTDNV